MLFLIGGTGIIAAVFVGLPYGYKILKTEFERSEKTVEYTSAPVKIPEPLSLAPEIKENRIEIIEETEPKKEPEEIFIVAPGDPVPEFDLDILFIHAHPDDESLDYGCLLAMADSAGLKTGIVTFTDGESGLDLYPERLVGGRYPDYYMEGSELASVRAQEVKDAADVLGADLLIRLGFRNHPYNTIKDEKNPEEISGDLWRKGKN